MWTPTTRRKHSRDGLRYETDLTEGEWRVIEPYLPPAEGRGRPRKWPIREIVNACETAPKWDPARLLGQVIELTATSERDGGPRRRRLGPPCFRRFPQMFNGLDAIGEGVTLSC